jgi:hypothetical protein
MQVNNAVVTAWGGMHVARLAGWMGRLAARLGHGLRVPGTALEAPAVRREHFAAEARAAARDWLMV